MTQVDESLAPLPENLRIAIVDLMHLIKGEIGWRDENDEAGHGKQGNQEGSKTKVELDHILNIITSLFMAMFSSRHFKNSRAAAKHYQHIFDRIANDRIGNAMDICALDVVDESVRNRLPECIEEVMVLGWEGRGTTKHETLQALVRTAIQKQVGDLFLSRFTPEIEVNVRMKRNPT